jgi:hypothetical protein
MIRDTIVCWLIFNELAIIIGIEISGRGRA